MIETSTYYIFYVEALISNNGNMGIGRNIIKISAESRKVPLKAVPTYWYWSSFSNPWVEEYIPANSSVTHYGYICVRKFSTDPFLYQMDVKLIIDSCAGDVSMPSYCRVSETDEANNESNILSHNFFCEY